MRRGEARLGLFFGRRRERQRNLELEGVEGYVPTVQNGYRCALGCNLKVYGIAVAVSANAGSALAD